MAPPKNYFALVAGRMVLRLLPAVAVVALWLSGRHTVAVVLFGAVFCIIGYLTLSPTTRLLGPVTTRLPNEGVLLTLDDGPHPDSTLAVLDVLDRYQAKALFFVIGDRVKQWPELAKEIVRRGHTLGNHSQSHPSATFWSLGPWRTWAEIADCQDTLREITSEAPVWFRAPVGHYNLYTHPVLKLQGLRLMSWSSRGFDTVDGNVPRVLGRIAQHLDSGAIVLMHEAIPGSAAIVEGVLQMAHAKGLAVIDPKALRQSGDC